MAEAETYETQNPTHSWMFSKQRLKPFDGQNDISCFYPNPVSFLERFQVAKTYEKRGCQVKNMQKPNISHSFYNQNPNQTDLFSRLNRFRHRCGHPKKIQAPTALKHFMDARSVSDIAEGKRFFEITFSLKKSGF